MVDWCHRNGDRSDNGETNSVALCPNSHAIKTRRGQWMYPSIHLYKIILHRMIDDSCKSEGAPSEVCGYKPRI